MTRAPFRQRFSELSYAGLNLALFLVIGLLIWGAVWIASHALHDFVLDKQKPYLLKQAETLTKAITENQNNSEALAEAHLERAGLYARLERYREAQADYSAARDLAPARADKFEAMLGLARVTFASGKKNEALKIVNEAIGRGPSWDPRGHNLRAEFDQNLDRTEALRGDFNNLLALSADNADILFDRAMFNVRQGHISATLSDLKTAIAQLRTTEDVEKLRQESEAASNALKFDEAINKASQVIALRPTSAIDRTQRAFLYLWSNEPAKAFADFAAAQQLDPVSTRARRLLGTAYDYQQDPAKGLIELDAVLARDPDVSEYLRDRGLILFKLGRYLDAADDFSKASDSSFDQYSLIWMYLAELSARSGNAKKLKAILDNRTSKEMAWPFPVIEYFLKTKTEKELFAAADKADNALTKRDQRCEAYVYAGMLARKTGAVAHGTDLITNALGFCHPGFIEVAAGRWELRSAAAKNKL